MKIPSIVGMVAEDVAVTFASDIRTPVTLLHGPEMVPTSAMPPPETLEPIRVMFMPRFSRWPHRRAVTTLIDQPEAFVTVRLPLMSIQPPTTG